MRSGTEMSQFLRGFPTYSYYDIGPPHYKKTLCLQARRCKIWNAKTAYIMGPVKHKFTI